MIVERGVALEHALRRQPSFVAPHTPNERSLFDEDWWLDAAAPGAWDRIRVTRDCLTVGEMAVHVRKRWGLTFIDMPPLTRTMSPRLFLPTGKPVTHLLNTIAIVDELMAKLPKHDRFERALDPGCPSVQGFVHASLAVTHTYTFRSAPGDGPEMLLANAHQKSRNVIARAQRECEIETSLDLDRFIRLHVSDFGASNTADYSALRRIFSAAAARGQAEILFARLNGEADTAAAIIVSDRSTSYYWLTARCPERASSGANSLIILEAMRAAHRRGRRLDLDGYVKPQIGLFLMKFGLEPLVRPYVNRGNMLWRGANLLTTLARPSRPDRNYRT